MLLKEWSKQIESALAKTSRDDGGREDGPFELLEFWAQRTSQLSCFCEQLTQPQFDVVIQKLRISMAGTVLMNAWDNLRLRLEDAARESKVDALCVHSIDKPGQCAILVLLAAFL